MLGTEQFDEALHGAARDEESTRRGFISDEDKENPGRTSDGNKLKLTFPTQEAEEEDAGISCDEQEDKAHETMEESDEPTEHLSQPPPPQAGNI